MCCWSVGGTDSGRSLASERERILGELLVLRCKRGDATAWPKLIKLWQPRLFYFVRRLVPQESDAWDVLQQTWLGAVQNIRTLSEPKHLATWLYRIARNKAISLRRTPFPQNSTDAIEEPAAADDVETKFDDAEAVHLAMDELSLPHREALTLHFLQDLSIEQIAHVLDVPEGTVKSRLFHAKRALRAILERQKGPDQREAAS